ncbi:hypothetical protein DPMN_130455 [Dreissena polymorpha]|uniref:Uncharacterized protein n=1 Tax=Dreissena polymorpha TaxID=45954 RepID=A0A9D4H6R4_DREPO|nr:hypothetical protein DPMN_130455 [Dreissena polymorpha]
MAEQDQFLQLKCNWSLATDDSDARVTFLVHYATALMNVTTTNKSFIMHNKKLSSSKGKWLQRKNKRGHKLSSSIK